MRLTGAILGLILFFLAPSLSRADALYTYNLSLPSSFPSLGPSTINWSFDVPSILTASALIPASSLQTASVTGVLATNGCSISSVSIISPSSGAGVSTTFTGCSTPGLLTTFSSAITSFGTFTSADTTLGITSVPMAVAEPGNLAFLGLGVIALLGAARFRPRYQ
jgi:hypothetical protein